MAQKTDKIGQYTPPAKAYDLVRAFLDPDVKPSIRARCEEAKISRDTFYRWLKDPEFSTWFNQERAKGVLSDSLDVRQALLRECRKGVEWAIKHWHEVYGEFVPTQRVVTEIPNREHFDRLRRQQYPGGEPPRPEKEYGVG